MKVEQKDKMFSKSNPYGDWRIIIEQFLRQFYAYLPLHSSDCSMTRKPILF